MANEQPTKTETTHQTTNLSQTIPKSVNMACDKQNPARKHRINYSNQLVKETMTTLSKCSK